MQRLILKSSIKDRLFLLGTIIIAGIWLATAFVVYRNIQFETERSKKEIENIASGLQGHIKSTISLVETSLVLMRETWNVKNDISQIQNLFNHLVVSSAEVYNLICILDENGDVIVTNQKEFKSVNSNDRDFFQYHKAYRHHGLRIGNPIWIAQENLKECYLHLLNRSFFLSFLIISILVSKHCFIWQIIKG